MWVQHGVSVTRGERRSVVFWFTNSTQSCCDKSRPWLDILPDEPDAQYCRGVHVKDSNRPRATQLLRAAAEAGAAATPLARADCT